MYVPIHMYIYKQYIVNDKLDYTVALCAYVRTYNQETDKIIKTACYQSVTVLYVYT